MAKKNSSKKKVTKNISKRKSKKTPIKKATTPNTKKTPSKKTLKFSISDIKAEIENSLSKGGNSHKEQILQQRSHVTHKIGNSIHKSNTKGAKYVFTGIQGFDDLLTQGIPQGSALLLAGGAGSGKTIFALQTLINHAKDGDKCFCMSFEESEERLIQHMEDFGWDPKKLIKKGKLKLKRMSPFEITRSVDALLMKEKGELLIDLDPVILPKGFNPDFIMVDSLTAIASAFTGKEDSYRIYIEQLFRFFEKLKATAFLITETTQIPTIFSTTGVEEFLADGVIVLYNFKVGNARENAIEILKLRGVKHQKKIVAMQVTDNGITVYPDQEVFADLGR